MQEISSVDPSKVCILVIFNVKDYLFGFIWLGLDFVTLIKQIIVNSVFIGIFWELRLGLDLTNII